MSGLGLWACALSALLGCGGGADETTVLRFWAMGREGEVVAELMPAFEAEHPGLRVEVQQIPWSAAHEKLVTAFVGRATPDVAQLGNTWIPEFVALEAILPLDGHIESSSVVNPSSYFPGILETNRIDGETYGLPWYVDTRVLFYRKDLLRRAGYDSIPGDGEGWLASMRAIRALDDGAHRAIFLPINEWTAPVVFAMQTGSTLLRDHDTRGAFSQPAFRRGFEFYARLFDEGLAAPLTNSEVNNVYQDFERGRFAMWITGPWNLGELARRLPPEMQGEWGVSPMPALEGAPPGASLAGGSSLVVFQRSHEPELSWALLEYLARPEVQEQFYHLTGDLPAHREAWSDSSLSSDSRVAAFAAQLQNVRSTPRVPEWEEIASRIQARAEQALRHVATVDSALAKLDKDADEILSKRRWLFQQSSAKDELP